MLAHTTSLYIQIIGWSEFRVNLSPEKQGEKSVPVFTLSFCGEWDVAIDTMRSLHFTGILRTSPLIPTHGTPPDFKSLQYTIQGIPLRDSGFGVVYGVGILEKGEKQTGNGQLDIFWIILDSGFG